jgi:anti-anti-sigma regulatory factor
LLADKRPRRVLVDAERLAFADVSGLAPLIDAAEALRPRGSVTLRRAGRHVAQIVRLLGLDDLIQLAD